MNKFSKYTFILFTQLVLAGSLFAQDAMRISGTQIVRKGETMTIDAGKVLQFEPGATLQIEGSLVVRGTTDKPVVMQSLDASNPGNGLMIRGIDEAGSIVLENVKAEGLVQPLRFDPFWYRKRVDLSGVTVSGSNSGEPVVYVAGPLLDLREGMDIQFSMKSMKFFNNTGAVLLEKVGSDGIVYELDNLLFSENQLPGSDATMGILHLDVSRTSNASQVKIGSLAFNRNTSGDKLVGLSVSGGNGTGTEKFGVGAVYAAANGTVVYDNRVNSRVPTLEIGKVGGLAGYSEEKDFVVSAKHTFGKVKMNVVGNPRVVKMEDSLGRPVFNNANRLGDTLELSYLEGNPTVITLANGQKFMVPKLTAAELPPPIYRKVDTTLISPMWPDTTKTGEGDGGAGVQISFKLPTFGGKKVKVTVLKEWIFGTWFGGAAYGGGDIKHKFAPLPSTVEISMGLYGQYNLTSRFSLKGSFYNSSVSTHNLFATGLFTGALSPEAEMIDGSTAPVYGNGYSVHFWTKMKTTEIEGVWHLGDLVIPEGRNSKIVPSIGLSLGVFQYDPFRFAYKSQRNKEVYADYRQRMMDDYLFDLRKLGTEGQNFNPLMKPYSKLASSVGMSFSLNYIRRRWSFSGEFKGVYTSTDYLDDFGPGLWYGGDYGKLISTQNVVKTDDPEYSSLMTKLYNPNQNVNVNRPRSTNGLNDWYFQAHMGISYNLSYGKKSKLITKN
jgi:hypothetical protein